MLRVANSQGVSRADASVLHRRFGVLRRNLQLLGNGLQASPWGCERGYELEWRLQVRRDTACQRGMKWEEKYRIIHPYVVALVGCVRNM